MRPPLSSFLAIVLALHVTLVHSQDPAPQYTIKDHEARTGSKFRRDVVQAGSIPLNLPYHKLTSEQQAILKGQYESMGPEDEPPFPESGLLAIMTELHEAQKILKVQGNLRLHATVSPQGKVTQVAFLETVERQFDLYAAGVLVRTKFKPAHCAGAPCTQDYLFSMRLSLDPR